jgi:predicted secreted Zn-dependent protease
MDILGPADEFRDQHDAYTEWYVDWSYPNMVTSDGCATGPISVTVTITQTFPKWAPPPEASPNLINEWNAYIEALQLHESGHSEIGIDAGEEILRSLSNLPPYPTCGELEQIADAKGQSILDEFHRKEVEYDRTTQHGETQNARFP